MRERVTFFHDVGTGVDPAALDIQDAGLLGPMTEAVREDKITMPLDELPTEIAQVLRGVDELYIHWTSPLSYETLEPFSARLSPGFHLSCTPSGDKPHDPSKLCDLLQNFGQLDCFFPEAFTRASEGLPGSKLYKFYQQLEDVNSFISTATINLCPELDTLCRARVRGLYTIASLDISYDASSKLVKIAAFWPLREQHVAVPGSLSRRRTEVGILTRTADEKLDANHVGVSGILTVIGENKQPSPTMFDFPSRHWKSDADFTAEFLLPSGLHPTLQLSISSNQPPLEDANCAAHAYLTLPRAVFADRYQLADQLFLASKNLTSLRYTTLPVDLEAPEYTTATWGSNILLQLSPPSPGDAAAPEAWTAEVPLHLRYLRPTATGQVDVELPYPAVFWACDSGDTEISANPFDRAHLGYDDLFPAGTTFHHVAPRPAAGNGSARVMSPISVPVLKDEAAPWVGLGTGLAVAVGFAWVLWKLVAVSLGEPAGKAADGKKGGAKVRKNK